MRVTHKSRTASSIQRSIVTLIWLGFAIPTAHGTCKSAEMYQLRAAEYTDEEISKLCGHSIPPATELGSVQIGSGCSFVTDVTNVSVKTFASEDEARQHINDIVGAVDLEPNFDIRAANVPNALATISGAKRAILYNPSFIRDIRLKTGTNWAGISVLAHEVGHHLQGHTLERGGSRPHIELQADQFSGGVLQKMGASMDEAMAAMSLIASPTGSSTHPARDQRLAAIKTGWKASCRRDAACSGSSTPMPTPIPEKSSDPLPQPHWPPRERPQPVSVARACVTQLGPCPMMEAIPIGRECHCRMPFGGAMPGITQ